MGHLNNSKDDSVAGKKKKKEQKNISKFTSIDLYRRYSSHSSNNKDDVALVVKKNCFFFFYIYINLHESRVSIDLDVTGHLWFTPITLQDRFMVSVRSPMTSSSSFNGIV